MKRAIAFHRAQRARSLQSKDDPARPAATTTGGLVQHWEGAPNRPALWDIWGMSEWLYCSFPSCRAAFRGSNLGVGLYFLYSEQLFVDLILE